MKNKEEVFSQLTGLFSTQKFAVLSTNQQGQPYSNLVAFVSARDLKTLYFATTRVCDIYSRNSAQRVDKYSCFADVLFYQLSRVVYH